MPSVYPFRAVQYRAGSGDVSNLVAPPYDVLDAAGKQSLLNRDPGNIVGIDLPHVPAKELGPPEAYESANRAYRDLLTRGTLSQRSKPAMFAYVQTFEFMGQTWRRKGMACTVSTEPLGPRPGGGILPHEQTFSGPKEDRLALMKSTRTQLSPIFGLLADESGRATALVEKVIASRRPDLTADLGDGVKHEVWTVDDPGTIKAYQDALAGEDVFIADGHHRYNTAVNYLDWLESQAPVPADHPARRTMFVLVGMSDPGLAIGPTHRVLGGMKDYTIDNFIEASAGVLNVEPVENDPHRLLDAIESISARENTNVIGVLDFATGLCYCAWPAVDDPLEDRFSDKSEAWRSLDVAIIQHLIVEEICQPALNAGNPVKWAFPHSIDEVLAIGRGGETGAGGGAGFAQIALIVRPTPLDSVRDVSRACEVMPQKSTFFYPKLATGLFINPLE
ncbi:MAG: DUF1015 domain-containing protein [Leptolyngbya sp. PLA3]|nr:MAG: DUF1015 domain-containing protein [Cyanobacteria bacterium CYA]MCE7969293.1 DUF1015 domain-containing protein [Leptolyngbya sp. PL-A3]